MTQQELRQWVETPHGDVTPLRLARAVAESLADRDQLLAACKTAFTACDVYRGQSDLIDESLEHLRAAIAKSEDRT